MSWRETQGGGAARASGKAKAHDPVPLESTPCKPFCVSKKSTRKDAWPPIHAQPSVQLAGALEVQRGRYPGWLVWPGRGAGA